MEVFEKGCTKARELEEFNPSVKVFLVGIPIDKSLESELRIKGF